MTEDSAIYNAAKLPTVIFSHGKESGPKGEKIVALAEIAQKHGYKTVNVDYRGIENPEQRVMHLLEVGSELQEPFILVGSSMGSYVSIKASHELKTVGLFLLAPAIGLPAYKMPYVVPNCKKVTIIHAWEDEIIPVGNIIQYSQKYKTELHIVNSDHRLSGQIPLLKSLFEHFLTTT